MVTNKKGLTLVQAAVISFALSVIIGILAVGFPFLLAYGACTTFLGWLGLCNGTSILVAFSIALATFAVIGTIGGVLAFVIWRAIPAPVQFLIIIGLFLAGLLLLQPELDVVALLGLIFTVKGVSKAPLAMRRGVTTVNTFAGLMLQVVGILTILGAIGYLLLGGVALLAGPVGIVAALVLVVFFIVALGVGLAFFMLGRMLKTSRRKL